jgi:hypothetical protein
MGWTEADRVSRWVQKRFTLERGLAGGLLILVMGLMLGVAAVVLLFDRAGTQPGIDVPLTRMAIIAVFLTLFGIQVVFGTFYVSFLDVGRTLK